MEGGETAPTPLPAGQVLTVFLVQLCEGININVLFPFVAFMVEDFGYTGKELGYHVGGLAATFCLAQFVSAIPWGALSDRVGRKPPVVMGVLGSALGMVVLGLSNKYWQAILGRAISGLLTGNVGILKSFLTEITDDSNRGHGFALMSLGWSLGTILGPLAGGLLSYPAKKYPSIFSSDGMFANHPFLLPCLVCVACNVVSGLITIGVMEESRWKKTDQEPQETKMDGAGIFVRIAERLCGHSGDNGVYEELDTTEHSKDCLETEKEDNNCIADTDQEDEQDSDIEFSAAESQLLSTLGVSSEEGIEMSAISGKEMESLGNSTADTGTTGDGLVTREVVLAIGAYGLCAMGYIVIDETIPLMLKLDRTEGGLSYTSSEIGMLIALGGMTMLIWNIFLLPKISHHSKLWLFKTFNVACIPVAFSYPALAAVSGYILEAAGGDLGRKIVFSLYVVIMTAKNCLATIIFLAVILFVNHSVHDHQLGAVNGLAQTVAALARAVGPAVGGFLWSLSAHLHIIYINYICAVAIFMVMQYLVHQLPHTIDHAKTHRRAGQHAQLQHGQSPVEEYESVATLLQAGADDDMQEFEYNAV